jgi:type III restriction enzyme
MELKDYQHRVLESVDRYCRACVQFGDPDVAFYQTTKALWEAGSQYRPVSGFPEDMPYFCLRVPTGGGKTLLAAHAVPLVNNRLLHTEHSVVLWLVPSKAIKDQTLNALKNREHPYRQVLEAECGTIEVLDLDEAKAVTRATLDTATTIIVSTSQAFNVGDTEIRKVYESSGTLQHHFDNLPSELRKELLTDDGKETVPYSLANVLRMRRPLIVVDEAHNNRTELSFDTLARFRPSCILELTATPDTAKRPSNVLHSVSAMELKAEEMIKLPILLETQADWQKLLGDAIARRGELQELAKKSEMETKRHLRPIVLIQAQPRSKDQDTLHVDALKEDLLKNHNVPEEEIAIATGDQKDLTGVDLFDEKCPIKYILTQQALAEGWDCSFAYILASVAEMKSSKAVEQILGRILRMPEARRFPDPRLNQSYAYVASHSFRETAENLRDALVSGSGFEEVEASEFVQAAREEQIPLGISANSRRTPLQPVKVEIKEDIDVSRYTKPLKEKISWDKKSKSLVIKEPLSSEEVKELDESVVMVDSKALIQKAAEEISTRKVPIFETPSQRGIPFSVPQLVLDHGKEQYEFFDDLESLNYSRELPILQAVVIPEELEALNQSTKVAETGALDVVEGKVKYISGLQKDFQLSYTPEHWNQAKLGGWLCRNIQVYSVTHDELLIFIDGWLNSLLGMTGWGLSKANQYKFVLRGLLEKRIHAIHEKARAKAWQETLFEEKAVRIEDGFAFLFHPDGYAPDTVCSRSDEFNHHYYPEVGDLKETGEEFLCAQYLDQLAEKGEIEFWVRNLVRKGNASFFLQTAKDKFYPDFVCKLPDGRILVVEYKGADRWKEAEDDRRLGDLWAELSGGKCLFVMVTEKKWEMIDSALK